MEISRTVTELAASNFIAMKPLFTWNIVSPLQNKSYLLKYVDKSLPLSTHSTKSQLVPLREVGREDPTNFPSKTALPISICAFATGLPVYLPVTSAFDMVFGWWVVGCKLNS